MIDLKMSKKKLKELQSVDSLSDEEYPWGTSINLETEIIKKLGIGKLDAGTMVALNGVGKITQKSVNDRDKEKKSTSMTIQIQKMEVLKTGDANKKMRKEVEKEIYND